MTALGDPMVGRTVAQYDVLARIGGGGMGVVYRARDTKLGRTVALKFLPPTWSHDEGAKQRFLREAQAASATNHPNICTIHDIKTADDGQLFIVMAYYEGQTLKQRLEAGPLPVEEALDIATQVADGLAKAHAQGVVHRDVKPGNLMLTEDGVRILDFGLATFADALKLTVENSTLGTVAYMSPEQARGQSADARSDVWAAGVVLYEMLAGHVPFQGSHAEAIGHAIRNETPAPIRVDRPEIPEEVEQLVFRALHKDAAVRYQGGRELARALRQVRGLSLPLDLRTEPVPVRLVPSPSVRRWGRKAWVGASAILVAIAASMLWWVSRPIDRVSVVVAPVANQTGYDALNPFQLPLTYVLTDALADSSRVRVVSYGRFLEIIRTYRRGGSVSSITDVLQVLAKHSGARVVIVPTVIQEDGIWRASVELRDPATATTLATIETDPIPPSTLERETAQKLVLALASKIQQHFVSAGPARASILDAAQRSWTGTEAKPPVPVGPPEAAALFERGLDDYDRLEYDTALRAFTDASEASGHPTVLAWRSRTARLMRHDSEAMEAAARALKVLIEPTRDRDRLFVEAVTSEARLDFLTAEARHRDLAGRYKDDPFWLGELAAFLERRGRTTDAIVAYQQALALDSRLARPHVELCRLYNRRNESPTALEHGRQALSIYDAVANQPGAAQARMCLADGLKAGNEPQLAEARNHADAAVKTLSEVGATYNLARGEYYVAMIAGFQGNLPEAVDVGQQALAAARRTGNLVLEPLVLMNLGVANARMRRQAPALDYYRQSSAQFEALGDEHRAAQNHLNAGWLVVDYGGNLDEGLRDLRAALAVFDRLGDKTFEVYSRHALSTYYLSRGEQDNAERQLNRAIELAKDQKFNETMATLMIDSAVVRFARADYEGARAILDAAVGDGKGPDAPRALIRRGQAFTWLGEFTSARGDLLEAERLLRERTNTALGPLLLLAQGELAYQSGDFARARRAFTDASAPSAGDFPDPASVEARIRLAAMSENTPAGRRLVEEAWAQAKRTGRVSLEASAVIALARVEFLARRFDAALKALDAVPGGPPARVSPELIAQVHHWRGRTLLEQGDRAAASRHVSESRRVLETLRMSLPEQYRTPFGNRTDVKEMFAADVRLSTGIR